jgi:predicted nucleic acid-binding protein
VAAITRNHRPTSAEYADDHVLACALAAEASLIVTRDLDLLDLKTFQNIPILAAADALRRIEASL